jgi:hypothetical protein
MGKPLLIVCMLAATLAAQRRLDLEALAKRIDPGDTPAVLPLVPQALVQQSEWVVEGASQADLDTVLRWAEPEGQLFRVAAIHVLGQSDEARGTAAGLLREIVACSRLGTPDPKVDTLRRTLGVAEAEGSWTKRVMGPAHRRACALAARLMREHAGDVAIAELLKVESIFGDATAEVRDEVMHRLGERASAADWLWHAASMLEELDVAAAGVSLAKAAAARPPESLTVRRLTAQGLFDLNRRVAAAKRHADYSSKPGIEGQIAELRFLQAANPAAAVERSRKLVAASVEYALPFSVLASDAALMGRREEVHEHLARACKLPGHDLLTVSVAFWNRLMPQLRRLAAKGEEGARQIVAVLEECDGLIGDDPSDEAVIYRWLRKELHWLEGKQFAPVPALPAAQALQASLPDSLQAYYILLAAALFAEDAAAARAVLLRPVPGNLAALHEVAWLRAAIYVTRELREDRALVDAELDQVLGDLERVQQDPGDASYLRGVRAWWESTRGDRGAELREKARKLFVVAQRGFGQRGAWRAAGAVGVIDAARGEPIDLTALRRVPVQEGLADTNCLAAYPALCCAQPDIDLDGVKKLQSWAINLDSSRAVVQSAMASARKRLGDDDGAQAAARIALEASAEDSPTRLPLGRGVVMSGRFGMDLAFRTAWPNFQVSLAAELLVVPVVMGREQLQRLAGGK